MPQKKRKSQGRRANGSNKLHTAIGRKLGKTLPCAIVPCSQFHYSAGRLRNHWVLSIFPGTMLAAFICLLIPSGDLASVTYGTITTLNESRWSPTFNTFNTTPTARYKLGMTVLRKYMYSCSYSSCSIICHGCIHVQIEFCHNNGKVMTKLNDIVNNFIHAVNMASIKHQLDASCEFLSHQLLMNCISHNKKKLCSMIIWIHINNGSTNGLLEAMNSSDDSKQICMHAAEFLQQSILIILENSDGSSNNTYLSPSQQREKEGVGSGRSFSLCCVSNFT